ncbi:MAG TPA: lipopolysaccharide biosynthesis protein [Chitinophaga sp.]
MEAKQPTHAQQDEMSLRELIIKVQEWVRYLLSKWLVIVIFGLLGGGLGLLLAVIKQPKYVAELTFVLEDSKSSNPLSAYAGIASQFGIDLGGMGSGSGIFAGDNILQFLRSRLMIEKTLLTPVVHKGKEQSLADLYIQVNELRDKWAKDPALKNISLPPSDRKKFSLVQDSVLFLLYDRIVKNDLDVEKPDKKLTFISVKCVTRDEIFSKFFTERLVKVATDFYVDTKTKRYKTNIDKLQAEADGLEAALNRKTYAVAQSQDVNLNPARSLAGVSTELVTRDKIVLQTMYAEVVKNLELSKITMAQETPIIQIVDVPILPLEKDRLGKLKALVLGGLLSGFLTVGWLVIRKFYRNVMS